MKSLEQAIEKARLPMAVDSNNPSAVAAVSEQEDRLCSAASPPRN